MHGHKHDSRTCLNLTLHILLLNTTNNGHYHIDGLLILCSHFLYSFPRSYNASLLYQATSVLQYSQSVDMYMDHHQYLDTFDNNEGLWYMLYLADVSQISHM